MNGPVSRSIKSVVFAGALLTLVSPASAWFGRGEKRAEIRHGAGVLDVQLLPDRGKTLNLSRVDQNRWTYLGKTEGLVGGSYSIVLKNRSSERLKVVVGVDGLNVYGKDEIVGRAGADTGSILSPYETRTLQGWQINSERAQRFVFSPPEWSEGGGRRDSDIGLIIVQVYRERPRRHFGLRDSEEKAAPDADRLKSRKEAVAPQPQIGTTAGDEIGSRVRTVFFESLTRLPEAWAEIDYGRHAKRAGCRRGLFLGMLLSPAEEGSRISTILPGSTAESAGLQVNDIIIRVDTEDRPDPEEVRGVVNSKQPGEFLFLRVRRARHELMMKIRA